MLAFRDDISPSSNALSGIVRAKNIVLQVVSDLLMNKMAGIYKGWASLPPLIEMTKLYNVRSLFYYV